MDIDLNNNFWAGISGAMLGAIIGGAITYALQRNAQKHDREIRDQEKKEKQSALAHSLVLKMLRMHSNIVNYRDHIEMHFARAAGKSGAEPWLFVVPLASHPERVLFSVDELTLLLSFKEMDLANELLPLDCVHNATVGAFEKFCEKSEALRGSLEGTPTGKKNEIVTLIPEKDIPRIYPKTVEINDLIEQLRDTCNKDAALYWETLLKLAKAFKTHLGFSVSFALKSELNASMKDELRQAEG